MLILFLNSKKIHECIEFLIFIYFSVLLALGLLQKIYVEYFLIRNSIFLMLYPQISSNTLITIIFDFSKFFARCTITPSLVTNVDLQR